MKIFICASKYCYHLIPPIKQELEKQGHIIALPNSFNDPMKEEQLKKLDAEQHVKWKSKRLLLQEKNIKENDAILVLNEEKNGVKNYIGGATFLEMFKAFELGKAIFLFNPIPEGILSDEIKALKPVILNKNISLLNEYKKT